MNKNPAATEKKRKSILREQIYRKLLKLGASYKESTATSEVVQMAAEGVEQLDFECWIF